MGWIMAKEFGEDHDSPWKIGKEKVSSKEYSFEGRDSFDRFLDLRRISEMVENILKLKKFSPYPYVWREIEVKKLSEESEILTTTHKVVVKEEEDYGFYLEAVDFPFAEDNLCADGYTVYPFYPTVEAAIEQAVFLHGDSLDLKNETITVSRKEFISCKVKVTLYEYVKVDEKDRKKYNL